ncbi:MAG: hypothetical protein Q8P18_01775 [Pseudomonadota bacterium]|nr:hypothetical protein [Pseudomonadota bacterium]
MCGRWRGTYVLVPVLLACGTARPLEPGAAAPEREEGAWPGRTTAVREAEEGLIRTFLARDGWTLDSCDRNGLDTKFEQIWCLASRGDQHGRFAIVHTQYGFGEDWAHRAVGDAVYTVQLQDMAASDEILDGLLRAGVTSDVEFDATLPSLGWTVVADPQRISKHGHAVRGAQQAVVRSWDAPRSAAPGSRRRDEEGTSCGVVGSIEILVTVWDITRAWDVLDRWVPEAAL